jgi:hypothetical protein
MPKKNDKPSYNTMVNHAKKIPLSEGGKFMNELNGFRCFRASTGEEVPKYVAYASGLTAAMLKMRKFEFYAIEKQLCQK